jgi:hypothetical protein
MNFTSNVACLTGHSPFTYLPPFLKFGDDRKRIVRGADLDGVTECRARTLSAASEVDTDGRAHVTSELSSVEAAFLDTDMLDADMYNSVPVRPNHCALEPEMSSELPLDRPPYPCAKSAALRQRCLRRFCECLGIETDHDLVF